MPKKIKPTEEDLLKALGELEDEALNKGEEESEEEGAEDIEKGEDESEEASEEASEESEDDAPPAKKAVKKSLPKTTKEANGGLSQKNSDDPEHFETDDDGMGDRKTMKSLVRSNKELRKGFEISAFLEALADSVSEAVDGLAKSVGSQNEVQAKFNRGFAKALIAIGNKLDALSERFEEIEEAPVAAPRSMTKSMGEGGMIPRFQSQNAEQGTQLSKSMVLSVMEDMAIKNEIPAIAVTAYESSSYMDPGTEQLVMKRVMEMGKGR